MPLRSVLVFAGAGASKPFGVPVMKEMTTLLEERRSDLPEHLRSILVPLATALREIYGTDYDLEKLLDVVHDLALGLPMSMSLRDSSPHAAYRFHELVSRTRGVVEPFISTLDSQHSGGQAYAELERAISDRIAKWCGDLDSVNASRAWFDFLEHLPPGLRDGKGEQLSVGFEYSQVARRRFPQVSLATTNYDLAFEELLAGARLAAETGFLFNRETNVEEFQLSPAQGEGVPLLKLHGSIDWWRTDDHRTVRLIGGRPTLRLKDGARLLSRDLRYPVVTKSLGGLPFSSLYARLAEAMDAAKVWVFVGYAFGDQSIIELVNALLTPEKRLVVIAPHASTLQFPKGVPPGGGPITMVDASFGDPNLTTRINEAVQRV